MRHLRFRRESGVTFPYTFVDSTGRSVTLDAPPENVAVLFSSYAEIWQLAGGDVAITVGDSVERGFASEDAILVDSGAGLKIDAERLLAAQPDFIIATADLSAQSEICAQFSDLGIPCAAFSEEHFDDYLAMLRLFTDITGNQDAYVRYGEEVAARVQKQLDEAKALAQQAGSAPSVLLIRAGSGDSSTKAKTAADHFVGVMLEELGAVNIADAAGSLSERLSLESILVNQPDLILIIPQGDEEAAIAYMESVFAQSGWCDLTAVQNGRYTFLPKEFFHYKPNARWDEAYARLIALLYPESVHD